MRRKSILNLKNEIIRLMTKYGQAYVKQFKNNIEKKANTTGNLLNSIDFQFKVFGSDYEMKIMAAEYYKYIDSGRKKGSWPKVDEIEKWVRFKGLQLKNKSKSIPRDREVKQLTYLIGRKIFRKGIKAKKIIPPKNTDDFTSELAQVVRDYVQNTIYNDLILTFDNSKFLKSK
jgi:hypothetical protein